MSSLWLRTALQNKELTMQFEHQDLSLWFGTADTPAPSETVPAGSEATITIAVEPISASNRVELIYRVNQGSTERLAAQRRPSHSSISQSQYFIARLPAFSAGDLVEYSAICHCAGRQVPSPEEAEHFAGSFRVMEPGTREATIAANESLPLETVAAVDRPPAKGDLPLQLSPHLETRINTIKTFLNHEEHQQAVDLAMRAANGDMPTAIKNLTEKLPVASLQTIALAHSLAELSDDHMPVVKALTEHPDVNNLRDVALRFNAENLATLVEPKAVSESIAGATDDEKKQNFAVALQHKLFAAEPTAVLQRMVQEAEVPIADANVRSGVASFLDNQPDFNIRTTSVYTALQHPEAFKDIAEEDRLGVVEHLKTLQRVQAISPIPEAVPILMRANLTTAFHVTEMPESTFLKSYGSALGEETARQVYTSATNSRIRNEQALITMRETMRGTGLAIMDGTESLATRITRLQSVADRQAVPLNLEALFGSIDFCECDECLSVYSPASYFVEILQYLRNNNLDPKKPKSNPKDIKDTPLEKLFRRRPDLGCLELTCQNTFTVLPYVDLVNEVMESFIVHLSEYTNSNPNPNLRESRLETFNIEDETTSELLAQPQHINYDAYCILKNAVYPFTLPYHQPIDAIRIFLNYLGTSFYELLDTYRTATEACTTVTLTPAKQQELQTLHGTMLNRAVDAEFLGLTQEKYIILTKKAFWPKNYFEITLQQSLTDQEYQQKIGVRDVHEYYGYQTEAEMLSLDETQKLGLTFVKKQFLPRTGIQYIDLVELLKTQFVNPNYPQGKALTILESIRFSYRFLQTLVDPNSVDLQSKYAKLIAFLEYAQPLVPQIDAMLHPDPCKQHNLDWCMETKDLRNWVYCYFKRIGKLIVLESGEGPQLPIEGQLYFNLPRQEPVLAGTLHKDGRIVDNDGILWGNVTFEGEVVNTDGQPFFKEPGIYLEIVDEKSKKTIGRLSSVGLQGIQEERLNWRPAQDTCDLKKVRLVHLDGSAIAVEEYDRIQRFIRLWHKMGWTIDETDRALTGLSAFDHSGTIAVDCNFVSFEVFDKDCPSSDDKETEDCPSIAIVNYQITPDFLHQLVVVRKLLDLTGLPLIKLLTFWADISTVGEKSLYSQLFLTHNLLGIDKIFQADKHGNYLTQSAKITDHIPVLMAALKLKADDIMAMMSFHPPLPDALTLPNVSLLYRHSLLAKILHVKVTELPNVIDLFGKPFLSAWNALDLLETWGKMEDAGFNFRQLNYIIQNRDDKLRPLTPSQRTILQITKTLYDGLNGIDRDHQDVHKEEEATADLIRTKASLLFASAVVEKIIGLLEGTTVYSTNAPVDLTIKIPESQKTLAKKLKYSYQKEATPPSAGLQATPPSAAGLQVTGILTPEEQTQAKALSNDPKWAKAIDRIGKQPQNIFNDALLGVFPDRVEAKSNLLAGDVFPTDGNTPLDKRLYFLQHFLPFLRQQLAHRFIVDTLASASSLPTEVTDALLSDLLTIGTAKQPAITVLECIKAQPVTSAGVWKGYLIPPTDEAYVFVAIGDTQPPPLLLDGESIPFKYQQEDPSNVWSTDPTAKKLKKGKLYWLEVSGQSPSQIQWKTTTLSKTSIPTSALLPDYSKGSETEVFTKLSKAALLVNGFNLSVDEVTYWQTHAGDFDGFDLNAVTLKHWLRLQACTRLRNSLPKAETNLLDLFEWATKPVDAAKQPAKIAALSQEIANVTNWKPENIAKLLTPEHFDLKHLESFHNEVNLVKLQKAIAVADKIAVDIDRLFDWAKPGSKFWLCHQIAEDIRKAIRARYNQEDWEQVVKPLNDQLREHQKQALISYLLVQQPLIDWGAVDADSLFEFFLIDVQMDVCMETSYMKQAISSVHLFVQRCFLGLEDKLDSSGKQIGVPNEVLSRSRWDWMQRYRVWEANRKVFCYPENWIRSELRDDKSPFYKELESELLQKDINPQTVQDAMKSYLFKVDEVAHLQVVGLFLDEQQKKLHIFGRTHNAPYFFYYRYFDTQASNWYPWEKMQVDISSYDLEKNGKTSKNGVYLIPVVWNNRLLIFFPQIMKKTFPNSSVGGKKPSEMANEPFDKNKLSEFFEIKMAWSEYRNGKWTQKQVSKDVLIDKETPINQFVFLPFIYSNRIQIKIYSIQENSRYSLGFFEFVGSQIGIPLPILEFNNPPPVIVPPPGRWRGCYISIGSKIVEVPDSFHFFTRSRQFHSLQSTTAGSTLKLIQEEPYFQAADDTQHKFSVHIGGDSLNFYHPFTHDLLGRLNTGNLDDLFAYYLSITDSVEKADAYGSYVKLSDGKVSYHELKRSYSIYNWEAAFHAPIQLVDRLLKSQQFEQALKVCHYVFNPSAKGTDDKRFWQFLPFKEVDAENVLENLFMKLQPNHPNDEINEWRDKPFQPHVVARSRPSAYMKWVVMKYIEILIAWGDYLFRQDTIETLNQATQLYVLAAHIYGPRGQKIPKRGKVQPQTYNSLLDKWDAFGNAMVELELAFPFSNQTPLPTGISNGVVGLANVFGFATTLYFCIPDNPQLRALRDTIDDRLFKIRHCQNIEGVFRKLPLFEPPIDPSLLVQAAAQGLSLSSVLNDLNSPMPNYRFNYLLQKALELCSELKSMGNALLSAKEKGDAEALSKLRAKHESTMHNLLMEVKKQQLEEAGKSLDALQQSRKAPEYRMQYYLALIGEDTDKIPGVSADFNALPNQIEKPIDESGLKLIGYEKEEMDKASAAAVLQVGIGEAETLGSIMNMIPNFSVNIQPIGCGASISFGGSNLGAYAQAIARNLQIVSNHLSYQSTNASRKGSFLRQLQDRFQQANVAGYEIKNIDKQILTQQIRINIANQEITNQQKNIDNSQEVEEFLRNKYTNEELYLWMEGQIQTLYYQAYTLAYELAKKAEKVFRFERGLTTTNFIQFGYWDAAHDGLLAGERLYIGLKQLEAAYLEKRGYDYEVTKHISLRQINPMELIKLKETGICEFALPEILFDMDYPGHYMRRIKSVAITIPCVVGPYISLNATLRLLKHKFRISARANDKNDYLEKTDETDDRFSTVNIPITSIACSTGQNDSGVFELNFKDERYLPVEGAGTISKWRLELPSFKQLDYDTISDAIVHIRYTAVEGGDKLKKAAEDSVKAYIESVVELSQEEGLFAFFDLKHDFPSEWYKAMNPPADATKRVLMLNNLRDRLPIFTKGAQPKDIKATNVHLFAPQELKNVVFKLTQAGNDTDFGSGVGVGEMSQFVIDGGDNNAIPMDNWQLKIENGTTEIEKLWLLVRYTFAMNWSLD
jgi:Tc toxin complex TcA C-terminal TcB-binding domain/Neuraminidase-like domain